MPIKYGSLLVLIAVASIIGYQGNAEAKSNDPSVVEISPIGNDVDVTNEVEIKNDNGALTVKIGNGPQEPIPVVMDGHLFEPFRLTYQCGLTDKMLLVSATIPDGKQFIVEYVMGMLSLNNTNTAIGNAFLYFDGVGDYNSVLGTIPSKPGLRIHQAIFSEKVYMVIDSTPEVWADYTGTLNENSVLCQVTLHGHLQDLLQ